MIGVRRSNTGKPMPTEMYSIRQAGSPRPKVPCNHYETQGKIIYNRSVADAPSIVSMKTALGRSFDCLILSKQVIRKE